MALSIVSAATMVDYNELPRRKLILKDTVPRTSSPLLGATGGVSGPPMKNRGLSLPGPSMNNLLSQRGPTSLSLPQLLQARRFSEVGTAMRARLSGYRMGWRRFSEDGDAEARTAQDVIVDQSKSLCGRYLRGRLRDLPALVQKRLSFQRLKSVSNMALTEDQIPAVLAEIRFLCRHLETSKPDLFGSLIGNLGIRSIPTTETGVRELLTSVVSELYRNGDVSWGKLAAMFALTGALALDCVKANKPELVLGLVEITGQNVNVYAAKWIAQQGGWEAMTDCFRKKPAYVGTDMYMAVAFVIVCSLLTVFTGYAMWTQLDTFHKATLITTAA